MSKQLIPGPVEGPLADNERLKRERSPARHHSAGSHNPLTGGFNGDNFQLIRFHGMYQQDDRDIRPGAPPRSWSRCTTSCCAPACPAASSPRPVAGDRQVRRGSQPVRQHPPDHPPDLPVPRVLKRDIKMMHQTLNSTGIDSIATAGDVNRNVLCTSNPVESELHQEAYEWAKKISEHLLPKTRAYVEIWLDGEKLGGRRADPGFQLPAAQVQDYGGDPPHNDVDIHANDLNFVAISDHGKLVGFNVLVGGVWP